MHDEAKLPLVIDRIKYLCNCYLAKIFSNSNSLTYKTIDKYFRIHYKKNPKTVKILAQQIKTVKPVSENIDDKVNYNIYSYDFKENFIDIPFNLEFGKQIKKAKNPNSEFEKHFKQSHCLTLFTDGSKILNSKCVGSAVVCPKLNLMKNKSLTYK